MANVGELFIMLGFEVNEAKLRNFSDGIDGIKTNMGLLAGITAGAVYGLDKFLATPIESATTLENLSDLIGIAANVIQKWEYAANSANPLFSKEAAGESIKNIRDVMKEISMGASGAPSNSWQNMLLNQNDAQKMSAIQFLEYIRKHFKEILAYEEKIRGVGNGTAGMQKDLQALGVASGMWQMITESQADFDKAVAASNSGQKQLDENKKLLKSINDLSLAWDNFKMNMVGGNADTIIHSLETIEQHAKYVKDGFNKINHDVKVGAAVIAAGLAVAFSPLFTAGLAAAEVILLLDILGRTDWHKLWNRDFKKDITDNNVPIGDQSQHPGDVWMINQSNKMKDFIRKMFGGNSSDSHSGTMSNPAQKKMDDFFLKNQVYIDHINAEARFLRSNQLTKEQKSNEDDVTRDIDKFIQTNHFNVQTNSFDEPTIRTLVREMEQSSLNILQSKVGNQ